ncbi:fanconi-associated nuclease [Canna indica]|uniref:Fanconi-associated nuclease n=1 Tax=Canna indica TaxID=4628 RepID=A0AAQ3KBE7_9LILI|nr:fanconi-associated nuclease [Canna indica]
MGVPQATRREAAPYSIPPSPPTTLFADGIRANIQPSSSLAEKEATPTSKGHGVCEEEWVTCPVCGRSIRGTDYSVNSHLDACLTRGTKRKLTQCTLLQFQFSKQTRTEASPDGINDEVVDIAHKEINCDNEYSSALVVREDFSGSRNRNICTSDSLDDSPRYIGSSTQVLPSKSTLLEGTTSHKGVGPGNSYICQINMDGLNEQGNNDVNHLITFETCIVGRRFHENIELQQGARISMVRDPENAMDKNAIKVLYADSGCTTMLGYLPRELSKYLAPPIDNHYIKCEGFVDSLPERPHDIVPVKLVCHKIIACAEKRSDDDLVLESLWENLLAAIIKTKVHLSRTTKYQKNFCLMIEEVMSHHSHLFTREEKSFIGLFSSLSDEGQRLFIRLYTRKGPWFQVSNITYPEVQDTQKAIEELQLAGYIYSFHSSESPFTYSMKEILHLLNVSEMRQIISLEVPKKGIKCARRHELVNIIFSAYENGACPMLPKKVLEQVGACIRISSSADILFWRVQRLFFLNGEQDLSAFLLVDLGMIKFPDYTCNVSHQIFQDRSHFLEYEEAIEMAQIMDESLEESNVEMVIRCIDIADNRTCTTRGKAHPSTSDSPPQFFSSFSASFVYSKVLSLGVSVFEREHRYEDATRLLKGLLRRITSDSRRGYWALRLSVNLEHMNCLNESLSVAEEGILDPWVRAGSKMALQRRVLRLGKPPRRWRVPDYANSVKRKIKEVCISGRPLTSELASKNVYYGYDGERCGVEQLALQYYADDGGGWTGIHSESGIWMTIFGLLMWDAIFYAVPDVFRSRFQMAPLDFDTDDFYVTRKSLIECQLQKIHDGMAEEILISSWELHMGTACRGVNWERHSLSDLRAAVSCIGGRPLASLCRHLAMDYRSWSSGMPDLLLWRFLGDRGEGEAKLVEVKGQNDRLSEQQRAWMLILIDCGFDAEVCKVRPLTKCP